MFVNVAYLPNEPFDLGPCVALSVVWTDIYLGIDMSFGIIHLITYHTQRKSANPLLQHRLAFILLVETIQQQSLYWCGLAAFISNDLVLDNILTDVWNALSAYRSHSYVLSLDQQCISGSAVV